jgi:PAS domain S-box-containing protein
VTFVVSAAVVVGVGELLEGSRRRASALGERLTRAERRFRTAEDASPDAFALLEPVRDASGTVVDFRFTYVNRAALAMTGRGEDELLGRRIRGDLPPARDWLFEGCALALESGEPFVAEHEYAGARLSGRLAVTVVKVDDGVAVTARDVTDRFRAAERDRLLAAVAAAMDAAPEIAPRVRALAELLADGLADLCRVDVIASDGGLELGDVAGTDRDAVGLLRDLPAAAAGSPLARAVHAGRPRLVADVTDDVLRRAGVDPESDALRRLALRSAVLLPLLARGRALGVALLLRGQDRAPFGEGDVDTLALLSGRAALALDNARLYEQQRAIAQTLQQSLLPDELPSPGRLAFAARYRAAGEGLDVGGDFYDVLRRDGVLLAVVGDVCGKGPAAAAVTSLVRHTLRLAAPAAAPAAALAAVNEAVRAERRTGLFCTAAAAALLELPDGRVAVRTARAGHPPPLVLRADGTIEAMESDGMLLGWVEDVALQEMPTTLSPGDALILYTDGVVEARDGPDLFGEERLRALLAERAGADAEDLAEAVAGAAMTHARGRPRDDLAVLVAVVTGDAIGAGGARPRESSASWT